MPPHPGMGQTGDTPISNPNPNESTRFAPKAWDKVPTNEIIGLLVLGRMTVNALHNWTKNNNNKAPNVIAAVKIFNHIQKTKKLHAELEKLGVDNSLRFLIIGENEDLARLEL